ESVEHVGDDVPGGHAAPFQTRPRTVCCMCLRWTPYSSASCAWVTPPASQRTRISRTCAGVSLERLGGRCLTGGGVRARWMFARARRTSWYASTRAMTSRLVCAVRQAWSMRSWALARRRSMSRIVSVPVSLPLDQEPPRLRTRFTARRPTVRGVSPTALMTLAPPDTVAFGDLHSPTSGVSHVAHL